MSTLMMSKRARLLAGIMSPLLFLGIGVAVTKLTVYDLVETSPQMRGCALHALSSSLPSPLERLALTLGKARISKADTSSATIEMFTIFRIPFSYLRGIPDMQLSVDCLFARPPLTSDVTGLYLELPTDIPEGWYVHRTSDGSFIITRRQDLPEGGAAPVVFGQNVSVGLRWAAAAPEEWAKEHSLPVEDIPSKYDVTWTALHGHTLLQIQYLQSDAPQIVDFLFIGNRVYIISLYPYPGGEALGIFNRFVEKYSSDPADRALSDDALAVNCAKEIPWGVDDVAVDLQVGIVTFYWWNNTTASTTSLAVPYEPETDFAGCSGSVKSQLMHIREMQEGDNFKQSL